MEVRAIPSWILYTFGKVEQGISVNIPLSLVLILLVRSKFIPRGGKDNG